MIDFTDAEKKNKTYDGANGSKIAIIYNKEQYMLKFPYRTPVDNRQNYSNNSCISEYIGSKIFASVGIPTQETLLGTFRDKGKERIVVACKDFTSPHTTFQNFASLKTTVIDSRKNGNCTDLTDILDTFDKQTKIEPNVLKTRFWDMFIVDALIGNFNRHNGDWGFLYNNLNNELTLAPVFDCASNIFSSS